MLNRRTFLAAAGAAGLASLSKQVPSQAADAAEGRAIYELRFYYLTSQEQKQGFDAYMRDAAIPAFNRIGISPVGVFFPAADINPAYVLLRHASLESVATSTQKLLADAEYLDKGAAFLNAPADKPAFKRMESSLFVAFKGMPQLEIPVKNPGRVFQLRTYESPSVKTGQKKIEMFNDAGEIKVFRRVGLNPVFFGETIIGGKMPNLTYMLAFESPAAQEAAWRKFGSDPDWQRLKGMAEYADKAILCGITNLSLKPAEYSQI
ncbi:MAG: NIPSNAP family protein [Bacillota bacterium]